jgi:hypothetical protein
LVKIGREKRDFRLDIDHDTRNLVYVKGLTRFAKIAVQDFLGGLEPEFGRGFGVCAGNEGFEIIENVDVGEGGDAAVCHCATDIRVEVGRGARGQSGDRDNLLHMVPR